MYSIIVNDKEVEKAYDKLEAYRIWYDLVRKYVEIPDTDRIQDHELPSGWEIDFYKRTFRDIYEDYSIKVLPTDKIG